MRYLKNWIIDNPFFLGNRAEPESGVFWHIEFVIKPGRVIFKLPLHLVIKIAHQCSWIFEIIPVILNNFSNFFKVGVLTSNFISDCSIDDANAIIEPSNYFRAICCVNFGTFGKCVGSNASKDSCFCVVHVLIVWIIRLFVYRSPFGFCLYSPICHNFFKKSVWCDTFSYIILHSWYFKKV